MTIKWPEIAHALRGEIETGMYPPGTYLPGIETLKQRFGCARETIRNAQRSLGGLLVLVEGVGLMVCDTTPVVVHYDPKGTSQTWAQMMGPDAEDLVTALAWETADPETAVRLHVEPGDPVLYRRRHRSVGVRVVEIHEQWIAQAPAMAILERLDIDLSDPDVTLLEDLFYSFARIGVWPITTERLTSRPAGVEEQKLMGLPPVSSVTVKARDTITVAETVF